MARESAALVLPIKSMKSLTAYKVCKIHGKTEFYHYPKHNSFMCKECAREQRKQRLEDPVTREKELTYAKQWQEENKDKIKANYYINQQIKKQEQQEKVDRFISENGKYIKFILKNYGIIMDNVLRKDIARLEHPRLKDFIEIVRKKKFGKLKALFAWKKSSLLKYNEGIRDKELYEKASLKKKMKIALLSQEYATEEANKALIALDANLAVNKITSGPKTKMVKKKSVKKTVRKAA